MRGEGLSRNFTVQRNNAPRFTDRASA